MIQDIAPKKLNNQYDTSAVAAPEDFVIVQQGRTLLANTVGDDLAFPKVSDFPAGTAFRYLFSIDEERYFLYEDTVPAALSVPGFSFINEMEMRGRKSAAADRIYGYYTGKHLADWYRDTQFCGRCGTKTNHSEIERAKVCPSCGYTIYPRIMPAVIVGVTKGDEILLTKYNRGFAQNALIAGFTEIGETVEETVAREVMEESGLHVKNIRYYKSQPWGSANDILMGYYCDVDGDTEIHMDESELKFAAWTKREDIVLQSDDLSLTNEMMKMFKLGKNI